MDKPESRTIYYLAGTVGFVLGGPLSAVLSALCLRLFLNGQIKEKKPRPTPGGVDIGLMLVIWTVIGSVAMPVSWLITKNMGWNLDLIAVVQSSGRYKSYRDWSDAEEREKERKRELRKQEEEVRKSEERARWEKERREEEAREAEAAARERRQEEENRRRLDAEEREYNDPVKAAAREERYMQHLRSVGCIDGYGQAVNSFFCMNTQPPPEN